ncbi:Cysteine proteinase inhibitor [Rhynchospora pubera]|uniref:Cysteine proteinase inhibitor n=1 Tax=Rhynchospora pubera TaxID=906938 RepID=A0AAV8HKJ2_9POAL|nr:Cysteine proteinase inhibitor [Rhynchospora pubera]
MRMFLILLPLLLISLSFQVTTTQFDGVWLPIENIADSHVQEIGNYAVSEHNRQSGDNLEFLEVISGERQVVAGKPGMNYLLALKARNANGDVGRYQTEVYEREWEEYRELKSFFQV